MIHDIWNKVRKNKTALILAYLMSIAISLLVYFTGGTIKSYAHLMYLSIFIVSSIYGAKAGVIHAFFSSLLLGPHMPLYMENGYRVMQDPSNTLVRIFIFVAMAIVIGSFSDYNRKHKEDITKLLTHDINTGLKNLESVSFSNEDKDAENTFVVIGMNHSDATIPIFGYIFSNQIIKTISERLKKILEKYKNVELYKGNGSQFVVKITKGLGFASDEFIIDKVIKLNTSVYYVKDIPIYVEFQMGISNSTLNESNYEGIRQAQVAYNYAKMKNVSTIVYEPSMDAHYKEVVNIAAGFSEALETKRLTPAYQKIINVETNDIYAVELLSRWKDKDGTNIGPDVFIPIIEMTKHIHDLTSHMIMMAVDIIKNSPNENFIVSINFSYKDFNDESIEDLINVIKENDINPSRIQVEIVERDLADLGSLSRLLHTLKENGVSIALDDFGTGYSSYRYLNELPIDTVKLDKSLICKIHNSDFTKNMVRSITDFCNQNNINIVAEGVETKEIADSCQDLGITYLQGFYYHIPELITP